MTSTPTILCVYCPLLDHFACMHDSGISAVCAQVEASVDVVCRLHQRINDVYDVSKIDVVVVGIFHQARQRMPCTSPASCMHVNLHLHKPCASYDAACHVVLDKLHQRCLSCASCGPVAVGLMSGGHRLFSSV